MLSAKRLKLAICSNKTAFQNSLENIFAIKSVVFFFKKRAFATYRPCDKNNTFT